MLESIKIKNFKNIKNNNYLEVELNNDNNNLINSYLITGDNGTGKTGIIELIQIMLNFISTINIVYEKKSKGKSIETRYSFLNDLIEKIHSIFDGKLPVFDIEIKIKDNVFIFLSKSDSIEVLENSKSIFQLNTKLGQDNRKLFFQKIAIKNFYGEQEHKKIYSQDKYKSDIPESLDLFIKDIKVKSIYVTDYGNIKYKNLLLIDKDYNFVDTANNSRLIYNIFNHAINDINIISEKYMNKEIKYIDIIKNIDINFDLLKDKTNYSYLLEKLYKKESKLLLFILMFDIHKHKESLGLFIVKRLDDSELERLYNQENIDLKKMTLHIKKNEKIYESRLNDIFESLHAINLKLKSPLCLRGEIKYSKFLIDYLYENISKLVEVSSFFYDNIGEDKEFKIEDIKNNKALTFAYEIGLIDFEPYFQDKIDTKNGNSTKTREVKKYSFSSLSSGEKKVIKILIGIYNKIEIGKSNIIFIDEIENSLSPNWQETITGDLEKFFEEIIKLKGGNNNNTAIQVFYATHSILLPGRFYKENIIKLNIEKNNNPHNIYKPLTIESFGQPYDYILRNLYTTNNISGLTSDSYLRELITFFNNNGADFNNDISNITYSTDKIKQDFHSKFNKNYDDVTSFIIKQENESILIYILKAQINLIKNNECGTTI